jgi:hypothetical protein
MRCPTRNLAQMQVALQLPQFSESKGNSKYKASVQSCDNEFGRRQGVCALLACIRMLALQEHGTLSKAAAVKLRPTKGRCCVLKEVPEPSTQKVKSADLQHL